MGGATCAGKVKLKDKGTKKNVTFGYAEVKSSNKGAGPRWLNIWTEGEKGKKKYNMAIVYLTNPQDLG